MHYGLDFGTSNSSISINTPQGVKVLAIDDLALDPQILRSVLYFKKDDGRFMGEKAIRQMIADNEMRLPPKIIKEFTGDIVDIFLPSPGDSGGVDIWKTDVVAEYDINKPGQFLQALKTSLREGFFGKANVLGQTYSLEELIGFILRFMKMQADGLNDRSVDEVVLGRPVHYRDSQTDDLQIEKRMSEAARLAGFSKVSFLAEPIAATLSFFQKHSQDSTILLFDFGGGTLDFCLMQKIGKGKKILATDGLSIGGDLFNEEIMEQKIAKHFGTEIVWGQKGLPMPIYIKERLRKWYELQVLNTPDFHSFMNELKRENRNRAVVEKLETLINYDLSFSSFSAIEKAKIELSEKGETSIVFNQKNIFLQEKITRLEFERMIKPYLKQIEKTIDTVLRKGKTEKDQLDFVICTGGSSLIPAVKQMLVDKFGSPKILFHDIFTGVAAGLAL
ncbi:MAG: Molecular chaperone-like protein [Parcubacteria group bacterium GW2011_GWA2_39_18]|nr:MAG: Molecular chaperone-like protein [Parcubacteria group bacterium GW2011_GWA2_39_18]